MLGVQDFIADLARARKGHQEITAPVDAAFGEQTLQKKFSTPSRRK
jgi:hypothetical protein